MTRPRWILAIPIVVLAVAYGVVAFSPIGLRQIPVAVGITAKQLCSLVFVSGLEPERAYELYLRDLIREAHWLRRIDVDREGQSVTVLLPGFVSQRAVHRPGLGCTLVREDAAVEPVRFAPAPPSSPMTLAAAHRDAVFDVAKLDAALDRAFREEPGRPPLNTLAVAVLHDGKLVAERYAEGITAETRLPGWSMTKSVTATLVGVLAARDAVDVRAPGAVREWRGSDDPRARITLDHLLRMTSGLAIEERNDGLDPNSRMLFLEADAAAFAASRPLQADVGSRYEYMSGSTVLAMRAAQEAIGGDLRAAYVFLHEHLFGPVGMTSAVIEPDPAGTFVGSSFMLASARDWARFGQLYLDGGVAGGRRVVTEDWIDYATTRTEPPGRSPYGAGFWLRPTPSEERRDASGFHHSVAPDLPEGTFCASGFQGQYTHVIPAERLVVVRLGAAQSGEHDHESLPLGVVAALRGR